MNRILALIALFSSGGCIPLVAGGACLSSSSKCSAAKPEGPPCNHTYECDSGRVCWAKNESAPGVCVSNPPGATRSSRNNNLSNLDDWNGDALGTAGQ